MGKVCSNLSGREGPLPDVARPKIPKTLKVTILKAAGLKHLNMSGDNIYVLCEMSQVAGKEPQKFKTTTKKNALSPEWNEFYEMQWAETDGLTFTIFDEGMLSDRTEGKVQVPRDKFMPNGYSGELPIAGCDKGTLTVRIEPVY
mmetsp:Transcript_123771/g.214569  ORF Transcript_123771/g.214569 Transcript_123771/m.214569 type:complete len:144 (-) Transcript_123771:194-625(-)